MSATPRFHGTWKGQVLEAIIVEGTETWQEIQDFTKLSNSAIKQALSELIKTGLIVRVGQAKYRVTDSEIIEEYQNYYQKLAPQLEKPPPPSDLSPQSQKKPSVLTRLLDFSTNNRDGKDPPTVYCKTCGEANPISRNYCEECGESLSD
ncbi:MAG: winged helix-turn-helix transcriptional regulator [Candidatus Heimdallarchaeota archaeon]|nr:winged helix-turn-helix transcriptional regulator [Candidatus Heimdallarchaeota archaeon]